MKIFSQLLYLHVIYLLTTTLLNQLDEGNNELELKDKNDSRPIERRPTWISLLSQLSMLRGAEARCIMRSAKSSEAKEGENPLDKTWFNGKYDGEPKPLEHKRNFDEFKKMCAPLWTAHVKNGGDENMPLCCADEQIPILKHSLIVAEQLIAPCAPCFLNFRTIWCLLTCSPNQTDFLVPLNHEIKPYKNFTHYQEVYNKKVSERAAAAAAAARNTRSSEKKYFNYFVHLLCRFISFADY